jgi:hypothetical protein
VDRLRRFFPGLGDDEVAELVATEVPLSYGRTSSLAELLAGWAAHVDRLDAEAQRATEHVESWTEHDYVAALHIRDQVEQGLLAAADSVRRLAVDYLARADGRFKVMTSPDSEHLLDVVIDRGERGEGWWWARIPNQGPVRDGLLRLAGGG